MAINEVYQFFDLIFLIASGLFVIGLIIYYYIRKRKDKNFSVNDLFVRKPIYINLDVKKMRELQKVIDSLGVEQRLWLLKNMMGRSCKIYLSADQRGLYIDAVAIHEAFIEQEEPNKGIG